MKRFIPLLVLLIGLLWVASTLFPRKAASPFDLDGFGHLPVLLNGRIKPLDTVARTNLLTFQGRQRVSDPSVSTPFVGSPVEWLADVCFAPEKANPYPIFGIPSPELLSLMGI